MNDELVQTCNKWNKKSILSTMNIPVTLNLCSRNDKLLDNYYYFIRPIHANYEYFIL